MNNNTGTASSNSFIVVPHNSDLRCIHRIHQNQGVFLRKALAFFARELK